MLIALGTEAAMKGYRVRYTLATKLVNELVDAADEKQLNKTIARYERVDLLCIDELGYMELDRRGAELLFQVLTEREEKNSVAIASNESFGKAHMFRRTRARCRQNIMGSVAAGVAASCRTGRFCVDESHLHRQADVPKPGEVVRPARTDPLILLAGVSGGSGSAPRRARSSRPPGQSARCTSPG